jgi:hypothetical protein
MRAASKRALALGSTVGGVNLFFGSAGFFFCAGACFFFFCAEAILVTENDLVAVDEDAAVNLEIYLCVSNSPAEFHEKG